MKVAQFQVVSKDEYILGIFSTATSTNKVTSLLVFHAAIPEGSGVDTEVVI